MLLGLKLHKCKGSIFLLASDNNAVREPNMIKNVSG